MSPRPPRFVGVDGPEDRGRAEAVLALYDRYASEFVEALRICPWADDARKTGRVERVVVWNRVVRPAELNDEANRIADDENIDVGLLLLPFAPADRAEFERLARAVREALDEGADLVLYYKYLMLLEGNPEYALHFNASDALSASQQHYAKQQLALFKTWFAGWSQQG